MKFTFENKSPLEISADVLIVFFTKKKLDQQPFLSALDQRLGFSLADYLKSIAFEGKNGDYAVLPLSGSGPSKLVCIGAGCDNHLYEDKARRVGGQVGKQMRALKVKHFVMQTETPQLYEVSRIGAFVEGLCLSQYRYITCKGEQTQTDVLKQTVLEEVTICLSETQDGDSLKKEIEQAQTIVRGVTLARDLVNAPSNRMGPVELADVAKKISERDRTISVTIMDRKQLEKEKMFAALAVAQGSAFEPRGVHLVYKPKGNAKKKIVLVGKAVTFDSGGLSIKPAEGMMTMKMDMAGAATVLGVFEILSELQVDVEVHGIFLAVENMPSGSAYRPGDVVCARNGKAIEVLNTDAEGRVTLADALSYASDLKPDALIDLATLTGACIVALGDDISALFSSNKDLAKQLLQASEQTGEAIWEMPLHKPYADLIKSKVGDLKNIGGKAGGAITAALFLQEFVAKDISWAHLDIAGPAYVEKETRPDIVYGGTGFGVRLLARYLQGQNG